MSTPIETERDRALEREYTKGRHFALIRMLASCVRELLIWTEQLLPHEQRFLEEVRAAYARWEDAREAREREEHSR